jgi:hypothetical protein
MLDRAASCEDKVARWQSEQHLRDHFREHGRQTGCRTMAEYDASAQSALNAGTYLTYLDSGTGLERVGCFDRASGRFVVLNEDDEIVSHFLATVRYIRRWPYNNYDG